MRTSLLGFGSLLAIAFNLFAAQANLTITQSESRNLGTQVVVHSATFDETRVLDIFVPDGYEHSNRDYPVIYVMDSDYLFDMTVAIAKNRCLVTWHLNPLLLESTPEITTNVSIMRCQC